ncbi:hypothetical protein J7E95_23285 [Streptomyces sp. ISL-14]|uniref:glutamate synthase-related protein n=1 Tax=Bacillus sp. ISL-4 TaxID=2819125 RepID=UPI001C1A9E5D|nr:hypothetical protein [Streptomyces sp. ISL-14]
MNEYKINFLKKQTSSEAGDVHVLHRPLGSSKKWPHLDPITFIPAQTTPFPIDGEEDVDVKVTIGPKSKKNQIPLMITGMAYGIALSEQTRLSLAEASKNVGTAINSGEGGVIPEELDKAGKYILQFSKTEWSKEEDLIKRADMIEIKFGQGALAGMGGKNSPKNLTGRAREVVGLKENEDGVFLNIFLKRY